MTATYDSAPATLEMIIYRGDDWSLTVNMVDSDGAAIDVSARSYAGEVATLAGVNAVSMTVDTASAASGSIGLSLTDTETTALTADRYYFDVLETDASSLLQTVLAGVILVRPNVGVA